MSRPGYVYRAFDADSALLYIGVTLNPGQRFAGHQSQSEWWGEVKRIELENFTSRDLALVAEGAAIVAEKPRYNVAAAKPPDPEALERKREERRRQEQEVADDPEFIVALQVVCDNCGHAPLRFRKRVLITLQNCPRCDCRALRLSAKAIA